MSFNVVNKTTGATTQIAGNADDRGIGNLNSLTTTNKSSLVSAINEVNAESNNVFKGTMSDWNQLDTEEKIEYDYAIISNDFNPAAIGNLSALHTTDQSSIVGSINEIADTKQNISDNSLNTTSKTIPGAINELKSGLTKQTELITTGLFNELNVMRCADVESISVEYSVPKENMAANTWVDVAVVSSKYRSRVERYLSTCVVDTNGNTICSALVFIMTNGSIRFKPGTSIASNTAIFWIVSFII